MLWGSRVNMLCFNRRKRPRYFNFLLVHWHAKTCLRSSALSGWPVLGPLDLFMSVFANRHGLRLYYDLRWRTVLEFHALRLLKERNQANLLGWMQSRLSIQYQNLFLWKATTQMLWLGERNVHQVYSSPMLVQNKSCHSLYPRSLFLRRRLWMVTSYVRLPASDNRIAFGHTADFVWRVSENGEVQ